MSVQVPNGVVDLLVPDDAAAVAARRYLSYFSGPLHEAEHDDQRRLIPENRVRAYDVRPVIEALCDTGSVLELRAGFGTGILTALVRIGWHAAGLLANHPLHLGGAIDERTAVVRPFGAMFVAGARLTVPLCAVVLRKAYGLGAMAMTAGDLRRPAITVAWPTGEFGGMGLGGRSGSATAGNWTRSPSPATAKPTTSSWWRTSTPRGKALSTAMAFEIDDVIDPAETRAVITDALARALPLSGG